jgi:MFS family permease
MQSAEDPAAAAPWPRPSRGWLIAGLLALASVVSQADRVVLNLMIEPVKAEFNLGDTGFGALQGVAFGMFYTLCAIPLGRMADRFPRKILIGICITLWSLFAMGSGLARSFGQLFATRVGVAVGEASLTPSGLSMLSDMFPPDRLGRPISVFLMSAPIGMGLAYIFGGELLRVLEASAGADGRGFGGLEPWQAAFVIVGAPGLLLMPLFLLMREPERRGVGARVPLSVREVVAVVAERRAALIPMLTGFSMVQLVSFAYNIWTPALFIRVHGYTAAEIGVAFGLVLLTCGTTGVYAGGWLSDRLARGGALDAQLKVAAFGFVGCGVLGTCAALAPSAGVALALLCPAIFLSNMPYACAGTALQLIIPNRARGQVTALYIMLTTLVGLVVGPMVVGLMTDHLFRDPGDIKYSLAIVVGVPAPIMFTLLMLARRPYRALRQAMA